jgi:hypothetical protein
MRCKSRSAGKSAEISRSVLLSENAKAGLSNSRVDTEGEVDVLLGNILKATAECNGGISSRWIFDAKFY